MNWHPEMICRRTCTAPLHRCRRPQEHRPRPSPWASWAADQWDRAVRGASTVFDSGSRWRAPDQAWRAEMDEAAAGVAVLDTWATPGCGRGCAWWACSDGETTRGSTDRRRGAASPPAGPADPATKQISSTSCRLRSASRLWCRCCQRRRKKLTLICLAVGCGGMRNAASYARSSGDCQRSVPLFGWTHAGRNGLPGCNTQRFSLCCLFIFFKPKWMSTSWGRCDTGVQSLKHYFNFNS